LGRRPPNKRDASALDDVGDEHKADPAPAIGLLFRLANAVSSAKARSLKIQSIIGQQRSESA
jgi:hypothetical protein